MGNIFALRRSNGPSSVERSLNSLNVQRECLEKRMQGHVTCAATELKSATTFKKNNNIQGACACMRKRKMHLGHVQTISGMINTLTHHMHSLESKLMSSETMTVMKESVQAMSTNALDVADVDDLMIRSEEHQQDVAHVTNAMGSTGQVDTDEELLGMLNDLLVEPKTTDVAETDATTANDTPTVVPDDETPDDAFERELEAEIQLLLPMPAAPTHTLSLKSESIDPTPLTFKPPAYTNLAKPIPTRNVPTLAHTTHAKENTLLIM